jgi:uncharacterized protein
MSAAESLRVSVPGAGDVSALVLVPAHAHRMLVLAPGAGAGMAHPFLEALAGELASLGVGTFRYQFPYMEAGGRRPDPPSVLTATVGAAVRAAAAAAPGLPLIAGGKSMGGRMTSQAAAEGRIDDVTALVFFGFPLHPPKQPGTKRAEHLARVRQPMLFLQGTRDEFAGLELLRPIVEGLGGRATLHVIEGADHSFHVLKRSGRTDGEVLRELAERAAAFGA